MTFTGNYWKMMTEGDLALLRIGSTRRSLNERAEVSDATVDGSTELWIQRPFLNHPPKLLVFTSFFAKTSLRYFQNFNLVFVCETL